MVRIASLLRNRLVRDDFSGIRLCYYAWRTHAMQKNAALISLTMFFLAFDLAQGGP